MRNTIHKRPSFITKPLPSQIETKLSCINSLDENSTTLAVYLPFSIRNETLIIFAYLRVAIIAIVVILPPFSLYHVLKGMVNKTHRNKGVDVGTKLQLQLV